MEPTKKNKLTQSASSSLLGKRSSIPHQKLQKLDRGSSNDSPRRSAKKPKASNPLRATTDNISHTPALSKKDILLAKIYSDQFHPADKLKACEQLLAEEDGETLLFNFVKDENETKIPAFKQDLLILLLKTSEHSKFAVDELVNEIKNLSNYDFVHKIKIITDIIQTGNPEYIEQAFSLAKDAFHPKNLNEVGPKSIINACKELISSNHEEAKKLGLHNLNTIINENINNAPLLLESFTIIDDTGEGEKCKGLLKYIANNPVFGKSERLEAINHLFHIDPNDAQSSLQNIIVQFAEKGVGSINQAIEAFQILQASKDSFDNIESLMNKILDSKLSEEHLFSLLNVLFSSSQKKFIELGQKCLNHFCDKMKYPDIEMSTLLERLYNQKILNPKVQSFIESKIEKHYESFLPERLSQLKSQFAVNLLVDHNSFSFATNIRRKVWMGVITKHTVNQSPKRYENIDILLKILRNEGSENIEDLEQKPGTEKQELLEKILEKIESLPKSKEEIKTLQQVTRDFIWKIGKLASDQRIATLLNTINQEENLEDFESILVLMVATGNSCDDAAAQGLSRLERDLLLKKNIASGNHLAALHIGISKYLTDVIINNISSEQTKGFNETSEVMMFNVLLLKDFMHLMDKNQKVKNLSLLTKIVNGADSSGYSFKAHHLFNTLEAVLADFTLNGLCHFLDDTFFKDEIKHLDNLRAAWLAREGQRIVALLDYALGDSNDYDLTDDFDGKGLLKHKNKLVINNEIASHITDANLRKYLEAVLIKKTTKNIMTAMAEKADSDRDTVKKHYTENLLIQAGILTESNVTQRTTRSEPRTGQSQLKNILADVTSFFKF